MKTKSILLFSVAAFGIISAAGAQTVINITGATAFRAAAHNAIRVTLGNATTQYAYLGESLAAANQAIFIGSIGGNQYIVRTRFSGSTQGVLDLAQGNSISGFLTTANNVSTDGVRLKLNAAAPGDHPVAVTESAVPIYSFSDVDKALSAVPNANIVGTPVGIVPFVFVAGRGAPSYVANATDQIHELLWASGQMDASFFSGSTTPTNISALATGRNNGSGTRASILSETGYGSFRPIRQFNVVSNATISGNPNPNYGEIGDFLTTGPNPVPDTNGGHTSNSFVSQALNVPSSALKFGGAPVDAFFVSYLTISDAVTLTGYDPVTGVTNNGGDPTRPRVMTYNGERYSANNVRSGKYSLWGYQQLYNVPVLNGPQTTFNTQFRATIPNTLTDDQGLANNASVKIIRISGDGGPIVPKP